MLPSAFSPIAVPGIPPCKYFGIDGKTRYENKDRRCKIIAILP
jgi:hypothetical protein